MLFIIGRDDVTFGVLAVMTALLVTSVMIKKARQDLKLPLFFMAAVLSCLLFLASGTDRSRVQSLTGENVAVTVTVAEAPYRASGRDRHYAVCKIEEIGGEKVNGRLRLSFSPTKDDIDPGSLLIGNRLSFTGFVYRIGQGDESIERYFMGERILLGAYGVQSLTVTEPSHRGLTFYFHRMRNYVADTLSRGFSDKVSGVLVGILTGDKSVLDDKLYEAFRESGVAHLMAVSGLHLSVWVFFIGGAIPDSDRFSKLKHLLLIFATVFIMLLSGMSESVKRAGFMSLVHLVGCLGRRKSDGLNSLGFALFVMILYNPACVLSLSLQLSFLSTLSILTLARLYMEGSRAVFGGTQINSPQRKLMRLCLDSFCISIAVLVFTCPVLISSFGGISTTSAWTNMALVPVTTPLLVLTGVYVLLAPVSVLSYPVGLVVNLLANYVIAVTKFFSGFRNAFLTFEPVNYSRYILGAVLIIIFSLVILRKRFATRRQM